MGIGAAGLGKAAEVRTGGWIKGPAFRTMLAGSGRPVEWALAFPAVEACQMAASESHPRNIISIDIHAARREARYLRLRIIPGNLVIFRKRCFGWIRSRIQPDDAARIAED